MNLARSRGRASTNQTFFAGEKQTSFTSPTEIASYTVFNGIQSFTDPSDPRYVVGRPVSSDSATLPISDVKRSDEVI